MKKFSVAPNFLGLCGYLYSNLVGRGRGCGEGAGIIGAYGVGYVSGRASGSSIVTCSSPSSGSGCRARGEDVGLNFSLWKFRRKPPNRVSTNCLQNVIRSARINRQERD